MDFENKQWDIEDQNLTNWLNGDNSRNSFQLSDILRSIYLAFRQKQAERLSPICNQAFEYFQKKKQKGKREERSLEAIKEIDTQVREHRAEYDATRLLKSDKALDDLDSLTQKENEEIIKGIISGKQDIVNKLYEYEFPKVVRLIIKNSGGLEMAQDVFQDAIIILTEKAYAKKLNLICSVKSYLYSISKYLWLEQLRQNKKEREMIKFFDEEYWNDDLSVHFYNTPDLCADVTAAINTLGDPCKELLECFYYKNMGWDEISTTLGYANAASARNQKYKCLKRIRSIVYVEAD